MQTHFTTQMACIFVVSCFVESTEFILILLIVIWDVGFAVFTAAYLLVKTVNSVLYSIKSC
jgi:hypothetical protein